MATNFYMPKLGMTMEEGEVTRWLKSVGESVQAGEPFVEVSTDKIINELESPADGVLLHIAVAEGQSAAVNALLAIIGAPGEKVEQGEEKAPPANPIQKVLREDGKAFASPAAKRLAKEMGIDILLVTGTGPGGRVSERDVIKYKEEEEKIKISPLAAKVAAEHGITTLELARMEKDSRIMKADVMGILPDAVPAETAPVFAPAEAAIKGQPLSGMRKVISERMSTTWQTYPHVTAEMEIDMTEAKALRIKLGDVNELKFSYTEIIVKACALALMEFKTINSSLINNTLYKHETANIGIAVALDNGLIVPVVKDAQNKTIRVLRQEISELSEKARLGTLAHDQISGGTFTISNMGMYGLTRFTSIINAPEAAILGAGAVVDRPVVINGEIGIRPMMNLCLSFDHRVLDGATAAQFLGRIRQLLEQPYLLF